MKTCPVCGKEFEKKGRCIYCSKECAEEANRINAREKSSSRYKNIKNDPEKLRAHRERARKYAAKKKHEYLKDAFSAYVGDIMNISDADQLADYLARNFYIKYNNDNKGVDRR